MATSSTKGTTKVKLTKQQKKLMKAASKIALNAPITQEGVLNPPPGGTAAYTAPVQPEQTQGQNMALAAAQGPLTDIANQTANQIKFLSGDVLSPESNPYLKEYGNYLQQDLGNQFATSVLPNIRTGAGQAGQFGSSRQGIAEGLGAEGLARQTGGALADLYNKAYGQSLDAYTKGLALSPVAANNQLAPALTTSGVGDVRRAQAQEPLTAAMSDYYLQQLSPLLIANQIGGLSAGLPGGSVVSSGTTTYPSPQTNPLMSGLGAASAGASLGSAIAPALGGTASMGALGGAGLGALLAFL